MMKNIGKVAAVTMLVVLFGGCASVGERGARPVDASPVALPISGYPNWMAGAWVERKGDSWTEEYWTGARGGIMLGGSKSGKGDMLGLWEQMQIRAGSTGGLSLYAMPRGASPTEFRMIRSDGNAALFENAGHDYPQRIRYWREGDTLQAEISMRDGSKAYRWSYRPMTAK